MQERPRWLIADDTSRTAAHLAEVLAEAGALVVATAADGVQALDAFDRHEPEAALIDFEMPGLNGLDVTRRIRERESRRNDGHGPRQVVARTLIVIATVHPQPELRRQCLAAGADHVLDKTRDLDQLHALAAGQRARGIAAADAVPLRTPDRPGGPDR